MSKYISSIFFILHIVLLLKVTTNEIKKNLLKNQTKEKISIASNIKDKLMKTSNKINENKKSFLEIQKSQIKKQVQPSTNILNNQLQPILTSSQSQIFDPNSTLNVYSDAKYELASNINCNAYNCQYPNACTPDNKTCKCSFESAEYELYHPNTDTKTPSQGSQNIEYCKYKRKKQIVYFLLEFFLNIGAGHLYAGNYLIGGVKLGLVFLPCFILCVLLCIGVVATDNIKEIAGVGACLGILVACSVSIWWLVDAILIGIRKYKDGNGVPLQSW